MPKRPCPFTETFSSQYKIHVSQKELSNQGVNGNKYRQEIYEKTKNLLFNGTKAVVGRLWDVAMDEKPAETTMPNHALLKGQTLIGFDGKLKKTTAATGGVAAPAGCCVCLKAGSSRKPCPQCERLVCSSCTQQCISCSSLCCTFCITIDYTDRYDKAYCCSCLS
ncbi:apoptosis regulatory protein Siva [Clupea harengus]|uniref:Apoptosis regulatory protein Siva n=1 Tax=Clupea harengus TaxID=7950 RepID=A0A6P3W8E8_CLUHA|nr:apoptosis regulatory protein Siva [Clupea harengus]